jgi:hypothetical protein
MTKPKTYENLSSITKIKRRNAALADPKETTSRINNIVARATFNNPVSVLALGKCSEFARHCLMLGASDDDAIQATHKYIQQLNGVQVG